MTGMGCASRIPEMEREFRRCRCVTENPFLSCAFSLYFLSPVKQPTEHLGRWVCVLIAALSWVYPAQTAVARALPHPQQIPEQRGKNQLALDSVAKPLFETVGYRNEQAIWFARLVLLMPDHLHFLVSFPDNGRRMHTTLSKWKE